MGYEVLGSGEPAVTPQLGAPDPAEVVALEPDRAGPEPSAGRGPRRPRRPASSRQLALIAALTLVAGAALGSLWATHRADQVHQAASGRHLSVVAVGSLTSSFRNGGHGVLTYEVHVQNLGPQPVEVVTGGPPEGSPPLNRTVLVSPTNTDTVQSGGQGQFIAVVTLSCEPGSSIRPQVSLRDGAGQIHVEPLRDHNLDPHLVGAPEVCTQADQGTLNASLEGDVHTPVLVLYNDTRINLDVRVAAESGLRPPTLSTSLTLPVRLGPTQQLKIRLRLRPTECLPFGELSEASQLRLDGAPVDGTGREPGGQDHWSASVDLSAAMGVAVAGRC